MAEAKSGNIRLCYKTNLRSPDMLVCVSIPYKCDSLALLNLSCNREGSPDPCASLGYALFEVVRDKLVGSPLEVSKNKATSVRCSAQDNCLTICWHTQPNGSMLRKTLGNALSVFAPEKLYSKFAENHRAANHGVKEFNKECKADHKIQAPSKELFNHCAKLMRTAISKGICCAAIGKGKIDNDKLKIIAEFSNKKLPAKTSLSGKDESPSGWKKACTHPLIKASGVDAVVVANYVSSKSGGMGVSVSNEGVVIHNHGFESKRAAIKKAATIKDYVEKKYAKLGNNLGPMLAYLAGSQGWACADTLCKLLKGGITPATLESYLRKAL